MALDEQKQHKIRVKVGPNVNGEQLHAILEIPDGGLHVGQAVSYFCDDSFSLTFPDGSLFGVTGETVITDSEFRTLVKSGPFTCQCSITPKLGPPILWSRENPESGGAHDVQPAAAPPPPA